MGTSSSGKSEYDVDALGDIKSCNAADSCIEGENDKWKCIEETNESINGEE